MFEIPSTPNISKCLITKQTVLESGEPEIVISEKKEKVEINKKQISKKKDLETA